MKQSFKHINESVIDQPKDTLDTNIWNTKEQPPILTDNAQAKIDDIVNWVTSRHEIPDLSVFIIGSITSNQYTSTSDIDIDFSSHFMDDKSNDEINDFGWKMKSDFMENYPSEQSIDDHPIEIFFQPNQFQCMMSVGCYNVLEKKWEVGPELADVDYDPMADIYFKSQKQVDRIISDVRNNVLAPYESSLVYKKSTDEKFKGELFNKITTQLADAGKLYKTIKKARSAFKKDPISKEDALKKRSDMRWQTKDSAFKLLDKYGYISILKTYLTLSEDIDPNEIKPDHVVDEVISTVKNNLDSSKWLTDNEKEYFLECEYACNESISDMLKISFIAGLLAIPGILPADEVQNAMINTPAQHLNINDKQFQNNLQDINSKIVGNFVMSNAINIASWTLYGEAGNQDTRGRKGIASVILNMAGGVPEKIVPAIFHPSRFSMWNSDDKVAIKYGLKKATSDNDYTYKVPKDVATNASVKRVWDECVEIATQLLLGKFKSTIGKRNAYLNFELTKKEYPNSEAIQPNGWYYKMTDKLKIKDHTFGYLPENDGYELNKIPKGDPNATTYVVKKGDSLWKIAFMFDTTTKNLVNINGISKKKPLKIGQVLKLKQNGLPTVKGSTSTNKAAASATSHTAKTIAKQSSNKSLSKKQMLPKTFFAKTPIFYDAQPGDNLTKISKKFKIPFKQLLSLNNIGINDTIQIGQKIRIK